jgi:sorting nexin-1/2
LNFDKKFNLKLTFQWESKVQRCQKEFDDISAEIKREMERFEINRAKDFKATVIKYLQDQMAHQQQVRVFPVNNFLKIYKIVNFRF